MSLEKYEKSMKHCIRCSQCKWVPLNKIKTKEFSVNCPAVTRYNFHSYSGGGRVAIAHSLYREKSEITEELQDIIFSCQLCGACQIICHSNQEICEPLEIAQELRVKCVEEGELIPEHMMMVESLKKDDNTLGEPKSERKNWADGLAIKNTNEEKADVLFHVGCRYSYDSDLRPIIRNMTQALLDAGVDLGYAENEEACCGARAYDVGYRGEIDNYADSLISRLHSSGATRLVTPCADCFGAFKRHYPLIEKELGVEVMHTTQLFAELIAAGKIKPAKQKSLRVAYHDPCHLGRLGEKYTPWNGTWEKDLGQINIAKPEKPVSVGKNGVYDPPREILKAIPGIELVEMERIKEYSWCCGSGAGVKEAYEDFALWTARQRIEEAKAVGAEALVTACGRCERNFRDALTESDDHFKVYDLSELIIGVENE